MLVAVDSVGFVVRDGVAGRVVDSSGLVLMEVAVGT
jgi:hypothetical protein